jgi:anti-sigma B factor antagonist
VRPRLLGERTCQEIFSLLYGLVDEGCRNRIVLDLARVEMLDSRAAGCLVMLNRKCQAAGGRLALCGLRPEIGSNFERMHLLGVLEVYAGEQEAVDSFPQSPEDEAGQGG